MLVRKSKTRTNTFCSSFWWGNQKQDQNNKDIKKVADILNKNAVHYDELGTITENELYINEKTKVTIDELKSSNKRWLTEYMSK